METDFYLIISRNMKIHNKTSDKANDSDLARWLWIVSEKWTRLKS